MTPAMGGNYMTWNYRVMKETCTLRVAKSCSIASTTYRIVEVYYNVKKINTSKKYESIPSTYCEAHIDGWDTMKDLRGTLKMMLKAFDKPVIDENMREIKK